MATISVLLCSASVTVHFQASSTPKPSSTILTLHSILTSFFLSATHFVTCFVILPPEAHSTHSTHLHFFSAFDLTSCTSWFSIRLWLQAALYLLLSWASLIPTAFKSLFTTSLHLFFDL